MYIRFALVAAVVALSVVADKSDDVTKCDCEDDVCVIVPPSDSKAPCYQGSNADTDKCFNTDPLLVDGVTKSCGSCEKFGFSQYLRNDPLYKTMSLYGKDDATTVISSTASAASTTNTKKPATGFAAGYYALFGSGDQCVPPGGSCTPYSGVCCQKPCPTGWEFTCP